MKACCLVSDGTLGHPHLGFANGEELGLKNGPVEGEELGLLEGTPLGAL